MRQHQFGRIENMTVQYGQPILDARVKVVRVTRLGNSNPGSPPSCEDFELKGSVRHLFMELNRLGNGEVVRLEFRHGLPFLLETTVAAAPQAPGGQAP